MEIKNRLRRENSQGLPGAVRATGKTGNPRGVSEGEAGLSHSHAERHQQVEEGVSSAERKLGVERSRLILLVACGRRRG